MGSLQLFNALKVNLISLNPNEKSLTYVEVHNNGKDRHKSLSQFIPKKRENMFFIKKLVMSRK